MLLHTIAARRAARSAPILVNAFLLQTFPPFPPRQFPLPAGVFYPEKPFLFCSLRVHVCVCVSHASFASLDAATPAVRTVQ